MKKILALMMTVVVSFPMTTFAKYRSNSDTGTEILDYIENRRREERANRLTEEQKKLLEDIEQAKENLPHPEKWEEEEQTSKAKEQEKEKESKAKKKKDKKASKEKKKAEEEKAKTDELKDNKDSEDKEQTKEEETQSDKTKNDKTSEDKEQSKEENPNTDKPEDKKASTVPAVFEGDDLRYDPETGEFQAIGRVDIVQIDGHRFQSDEIYGNTKDEVVRIPGKAHVLQVQQNAPRITLDGYRTIYNYGTQIGTMGSARGKAGEYYITGKRFEFYPDHIVAYDATQTKCGAKRPDYHLSAERMEIWDAQTLKMYKVKFWIKDNVVGTRDYYEKDLTKNEDHNFPKVGYDKDHGAYVEQKFHYPIVDHVKGIINAHVETKHGIRSNTGIRYDNRDFNANLVYGFFEDSDNIWIQKEPSLILGYGRPINGLPLSYGLGYEIGHWRSEYAVSTHQCYSVGLAHNPIIWGNNKYITFLGTGYAIVKESADDSTVKGFSYDVVTAREFDDRFAMFTGYHYRKSTTKNSLFSYNTDDYSREFETGGSYVIDDKNRFVVGLKFDANQGNLRDVDYYWYHDLHCSQLVLRYREKRDSFEVHWQFTPW